jgi:carbonic anhydrase
VEHVKQTAYRLVDSSRVISAAIDEGRAAVVGLSYKLDEGRAALVSGIGKL